VTEQGLTNPHRAIPNSTLDETGEEPSELPPPVLNGEGTPNPRPLKPPPIPPVINVGSSTRRTPNSDGLDHSSCKSCPCRSSTVCLDGSWRGEDTWGSKRMAREQALEDSWNSSRAERGDCRG
jgi:hypothetical protein